MFELDPDSMGAYYLQESLDNFDQGCGYDESDFNTPRPQGFTSDGLRYKTCRICKTTGLVWYELYPRRWILVKPGETKRHQCIEMGINK